MDKLESIRVFVAVAREGGFSAAARTLGQPVATVSRKVAELEAALGVRLFERTTRQVTLTANAVSYFAACARVLDDLRDADETIVGEYRAPKGELTITAPVGFGRQHLQPVALEFLRAYPEVNMRLVLEDRVANLVEEHVDLAVRIGSSLGPHKAWLCNNDVESVLPILVRLTTTLPESAVEAAVADLGLVQVTAYQAEAAVRSGALVPVLRDFEAAATPVNLVHPSNRLVPQKLRAFIDFAAPRLTARLLALAQVL